MERWASSWPHLSSSQAPWPMVASLPSCQEAQKACKLLRESQVSLQGKQAAWAPAWLLSGPMCCPEICQLVGGLCYFSQQRNFLSDISSQICSVLLPLLQMRKAKRPKGLRTGKVQGPGRPGIMAGLQSWLPQPNHKYTSEMSDIPSRMKYVYSL